MSNSVLFSLFLRGELQTRSRNASWRGEGESFRRVPGTRPGEGERERERERGRERERERERGRERGRERDRGTAFPSFS